MKLSALETFWQWRRAIAPGAGMAWDIETERLDPASPTRCVGYEITTALDTHPGDAKVVTVTAEPLSEAREFHRAARPGVLLIAHNGKYEAHALLARGVDPLQFVWWDTMLAEWVLVANNTQGLGLNLDDTAQRYGCSAKDPWVDEMIKAGRVMDVPLDRLMERNRKDVADCRKVFEAQLARMTEAQIRLTIVRSMYMLELAITETEGKALEPERVLAEMARVEAAIAEHELGLRDITGGANLRSVNEMAPVLYGIWPGTVPEAERVGIEPLGFKEPLDPKTGKPDRNAPSKPRKPPPPYKDGRPRPVPPVAWPDGKPKLDAEVLDKLARQAKTPRQKAWATHHLALVDLYAQRDKNLLYFAEVCEKAGGVVFADLMQGIAATHRLTCRGRPLPGIERKCQLQNVPHAFKRLFRAKRKGYKAAEVDLTQAEFRDAILLTRCPQGLKDLADPNFDAHIQSAQIIRDGTRDRTKYLAMLQAYRAGDKATKKLRTAAKPHTFKPLFGGGSGSPGERAYYKWFRQHYSGITAAQERWEADLGATGQYVSPTGMVFKWLVSLVGNRWGGMDVVREDGKSLYTTIRNLPIQYFATGERAMVATLCLMYECRRLGILFYLVMLVHDSAEGELEPTQEDAWHDAVASAYGPLMWAFLHDVYGIDYDLELAAESGVGPYFGEATSERAHTYTHTNGVKSMLKLSEGGEKRARENVPAGNHLAVCNQVVDLGMQPGSLQFPAPKRKVFLRFEVPEFRVKYKRGDAEMEGPLVIGVSCTASMNEKAWLRKFIEGSRGKKFKAGEAAQFDVTSILGKGYLLNVAEETKGDKTYSNIVSAAPLPKGLTAPKAERPLLFYTPDNHDQEVFEQLAPWLQKELTEKRIKPAEPGDVPPADADAAKAPDLGEE